MFKKLFLKWGLKASEKEIVHFINNFSMADVEQNGPVLGMAALLHYQLAKSDPEFEKLVNSRKGENLGPISAYILTLNRHVKECHRAGRLEQGAGTMLWNITFRCMGDESFHHHGVTLWRTASQSFPGAKQWLEEMVQRTKEAGLQQDYRTLSMR